MAFCAFRSNPKLKTRTLFHVNADGSWGTPASSRRRGNGADDTRRSKRIVRVGVRAVFARRSMATRGSERAIRSGRTALAMAFTYSIAPPSGYVNVEL